MRYATIAAAVTEANRDRVHRAAREDGKSASQWLRDVAVQEARRTLERSDEDSDADAND